jgi:hypothetical protein
MESLDLQLLTRIGAMNLKMRKLLSIKRGILRFMEGQLPKVCEMGSEVK